MKICAARANFPEVENSGIRILFPPRRQACPEQSRRDAKRQAQGLSSRANTRDLGKISLFVRNDNALPLRLCGRYSEFWLRLRRAGSFGVKCSYLLWLRRVPPDASWRIACPTRVGQLRQGQVSTGFENLTVIFSKVKESPRPSQLDFTR